MNMMIALVVLMFLLFWAKYKILVAKYRNLYETGHPTENEEDDDEEDDGGNGFLPQGILYETNACLSRKEVFQTKITECIFSSEMI